MLTGIPRSAAALTSRVSGAPCQKIDRPNALMFL